MSALGLCQLPASEMARLVRTRTVSAVELLEAHLVQLDRCNPEINAVVSADADLARRQAVAADSAIANGAPIGMLHGAVDAQGRHRCRWVTVDGGRATAHRNPALAAATTQLARLCVRSVACLLDRCVVEVFGGDVEQEANMGVGERVEDHPAVASGADHTGHPQQAQRVRDAGFGCLHDCGEVADAHLACFDECVQQLDAGWFADQAEQFGDPIDISGR